LALPSTQKIVESMSIVIGERPGPAPNDQSRRIASAITASSWRKWPKVNERKNVPECRWCHHPERLDQWVAPARSRSAWSMWEPPAKIVATKVSTLRPGRALPPGRPASMLHCLEGASLGLDETATRRRYFPEQEGAFLGCADVLQR
jgi:hypothetical protein